MNNSAKQAMQAEEYFEAAFESKTKRIGAVTGHGLLVVMQECIRETREVFSRPNWLPWELL